ncbi:PEP/pyruvate-binding domain-containing protein [Methylobacterium oryzae CBMB20]
MPESFAELTRIYGILESHYRDMQDMEFTIEKGKLWMLQTRNGKRHGEGRPAHRRGSGGRGADPPARRRSAGSSPAPSTSSCTRPSTRRPTARSSPRACRPRPARRPARSCSTPRTREAHRKAERKCILVRDRDLARGHPSGMHAAEGILTTRGG